MKQKAYILSSTYQSEEDKTSIYLFGKLENKESFVAIIDFKPYLYISEKDLKKANPLLAKFKTEKTNFTNFKKEKVIKIISPNYSELTKLASALHKKEINTYEADIKPNTRFLMDKDILGIIDVQGDYEKSERIDRIYINPEISPLPKESYFPKLKILSIDIESSKNTNELFCISFYSDNYNKSFIIADKKVKNAESCKDEYDLLEKIKEEIIAFDPDIITGWNVIDFDLNYLKEKFNEHKIPFNIGRTNENARIKIQGNFFRDSTAEVPGRQVLDALNMIKDPFIQEAPMIKHADFDSYTLEDVSQALLGRGKLLKGKGRHEEIENLYKEKKYSELIEYNLKDANLVYDILNKTKILDLAVERSLLTGMPLNKITASIAAFDSLYIREANKKGLVSPTTKYEVKEERIKGGYVMDSKPGIYHNLLVLDFKSLYPSIMKTFNIDPSSFIEKPEKNAIESPNNAYFRNENGILPEIIDKLHQAREKAKREKRELSSYAIKIIMNSFFGVLASPNCRYFNLQMANAITHFGQKIIKLTAEEIENLGYKTIYSDTDSVFVESNASKEEAEKIGKKIESHINSFYQKIAKEKYKRTSYLELQFEKLYLAFMLPPLRSAEGKDIGSKKRYAGLKEKNGKEEIEIVGLEAIRGDWTEAAQEFQVQLLEKIFHKEEFVEFIRSYVKSLKAGKMDSKLIYKKSIRKSLDKYTKTTPPHVKAARLLDSLDSNIIKYYITEAGPEPIQKHKHKIDYQHYIEKQIKPIANTLLFFFDKDFDEIIKSSKQMKLF